jgi:cytochrome c5
MPGRRPIVSGAADAAIAAARCLAHPQTSPRCGRCSEHLRHGSCCHLERSEFNFDERQMMRTFVCVALAVALFGVSGGAVAADGKAIYESTCVACHATGVANAPKFGDKAAWAPRVATGKDALVKAVVSGKGAMPAKAGNAVLGEGDISAAVDYMLAAVK